MTSHNWGPALWITAEGKLETARAPAEEER